MELVFRGTELEALIQKSKLRNSQESTCTPGVYEL
jgi:hypothetical protein